MAKILIDELAHPFIVACFGVFANDNMTRCLVLEYCRDGDLQSAIKASRDSEGNSGYQPPGRALTWLAQIFLALEFLHLTPPTILMRDVKPGNVLLTEGGRMAKLTDFGLSRKGPVSNGKCSLHHSAP